MRYRPFGSSGTAVSSLTLSLGHAALARGFEAAQSLIYSGLEAGINSFRLETADPVLADVVGQALSHVDRKLVSVTLMLGTGDGRRGSQRDFSAEGMTKSCDPCTTCGQGQQMDSACSASANLVCGACPSNTWQDSGSHTSTSCKSAPGCAVNSGKTACANCPVGQAGTGPCATCPRRARSWPSASA